jgi:hypothetical protein
VITAAPGPTENRRTIGIRYANAGMICMASRTGVMLRLKRSDLPAATPRGMPTRSERVTAASIRASVCMLSVQSPLSAKVANAPTAQIAAFRPPNLSATRTPTTDAPIQVIQPNSRVSHVTRSSRKEAKPLNVRMTTLGLSAFRWSTSHVWKSLRCVGSVVHVRRPGHEYWPLRPK